MNTGCGLSPNAHIGTILFTLPAVPGQCDTRARPVLTLVFAVCTGGMNPADILTQTGISGLKLSDILKPDGLLSHKLLALQARTPAHNQ